MTDSISKNIFLNHVPPELRIGEAKKMIKAKLLESINSIEKAIAAKVTLLITDDADRFIIHNHTSSYFFRFVEDSFNSNPIIKFEASKTIQLSCKFTHFYLENAHASLITITFDNDLNIEKVECVIRSRNQHQVTYEQKVLIQAFNHLLELVSFRYTYRNLKTLIESGFSKNGGCVSSFEDEVLFWKLYCNPSEANKELLPEYYEPSAYDFRSQAFNDRLKLFEMLTF